MARTDLEGTCRPSRAISGLYTLKEFFSLWCSKKSLISIATKWLSGSSCTFSTKGLAAGKGALFLLLWLAIACCTFGFSLALNSNKVESSVSALADISFNPSESMVYCGCWTDFYSWAGVLDGWAPSLLTSIATDYCFGASIAFLSSTPLACAA